jgi:hypothetical protein
MFNSKYQWWYVIWKAREMDDTKQQSLLRVIVALPHLVEREEITI